MKYLMHSIVTKKIPKEIMRKKRSAKGPPKILVLKEKKGTTLPKVHHQQKINNHRKKKETGDHIEGDFKKIKPSTFDGESRIGEEVEAWLLDIKKVFPDLQLFQQYEGQNGHL
jgi:hypothetical protein